MSSNFFEYQYNHSTASTFIKIRFNLPFFTTVNIPQTFTFLQQQFPGVLTTQCFNGAGLPFIQEVNATELGHLFEHILIRKIYDLKKIAGEDNFIVEARTDWDWKKEDRGVFNIFVKWGHQNFVLFDQALEETSILFENLLYHRLSPDNKATDNSVNYP